jgi:transposase-like protein
MSVSYVARRHGLSPSLVFRWRQLMSEGVAPKASEFRLNAPAKWAIKNFNSASVRDISMQANAH